MAYAAAITEVQKTISGRRTRVITVTETDAAAASEWSFDLGAPTWKLRSFKTTITVGSGNTVNPILGRAAAFVASTQDHLATQAATAVHINDQTPIVLQLGAASTLYARSTVDTGSDSTIVTELVLTEGAE